MIKIAPSLLSADFARLGEDIDSVQTADYLHFDVMDGIFVPNISVGLPVLKSVRRYTDMPIDVHLMKMCIRDSYNPNYPTDGSNINLIITQPDPTLKNYSQSEFEETFLSTLQNTDLAGIDISFDYFEKGTLDGYDTLYFEASYDYMGIAMVQYQYYIVVPGDCTYILTFTQAGDNNWTPEFDEMIDVYKRQAQTTVKNLKVPS